MNQEQLRKEARAAAISRSNELWDSPCVERTHFQVGFQEGAEFEAERDKWISVDVVLPEKGVKVKCKLPNNCGGERILYRMKHNGKWNDYNEYITHWQPLPTPPKTSK